MSSSKPDSPDSSRPDFLTRLFRRAEAIEKEDEQRDLEEVRSEERFVMSANFVLSMACTGAFMLLAWRGGDDMAAQVESFATFAIRNLSWFYVSMTAGSLIFLLYLALSRFGGVVLGEPDEKPEFGDVSWYAMLFSAGMGVGLLYHGVGEPLTHFANPPIGQPMTIEAARRALGYTAFHWGLHAWAIYLSCAVGVAYFGFRKKKKYLVSSSILEVTNIPWLRRTIKVSADLLATLAVLFGVAGSLCTGTQQITSGLAAIGMVAPDATGTALMVLLVLTATYIASAMTGLDKGVKILSNLNMAVCCSLMAFVLFTGPTLFILKVFVNSIGEYLSELPRLSFQVAPFTPAYETWMGKWTIPLFAWWIAWAPFVGIFIARISKGRTIRELVIGGLLGPTLFSLLSFAIFGGTALHIEIFGSGGLSEIVAKDMPSGLFAMLNMLPLAAVTKCIAVLLLFTFLVTSADSACFVIAMMTTEGDLEPPARIKVLWGLVLSGLTYLLLNGGGLRAVQAVTLASAFPFSLVMIAMCAAVIVRLNVQVESDRI